MALPEGGFVVGGAGITAPGGAYTYAGGATYPQYYAGTFFIDTGYDDPVTWTSGVDCAEVYGGRVYAVTSTNVVGSPEAGTYLGKWDIAVTPVWEAKQWATPHSNTSLQRRVWLMCEVFYREPLSTASGNSYRLDSVNWSLYRL